MGQVKRPLLAGFADDSSSTGQREEGTDSAPRRVHLGFFFGNRLKLVGAILGVLSYILAYFLPSWYIVQVPVLASGIVLWIVGYRKAKIPIPNRSLFAAIVAALTFVGFLLFTGAALYLPELAGVGFSPLAVLAIILGVLGAFLSMVQERLGGGFLVAGPGLALLTSLASADQSFFYVPIIWWSVPVTLGCIFLAKKRGSIPRKGLLIMGLSSTVLPWFTGWESDWYSIGAQTHVFNYFLPGLVLRDGNLQFVSYLLYLGLFPLALIVAGSFTFLASSIAKGSDVSRRKRSVISGILLMVAAVVSGMFMFLVGVVLLLLGGRYTLIVGFASAGCWLALLTGNIMAAPLSFKLEEETGTGAPMQVNPEPVKRET